MNTEAGEADWKAMVADLSEGVILITPAGRITFANNAALVNTDGSPNTSFGQISYTRTSARQIQVALRYTF